MSRLPLILHDADGPLQVGVVVGRVTIVRWAGGAPVFDSMDPARLTTTAVVARGEAGLGAAAVLLRIRGRLWVGAGAGCAAPVAPAFWSLSDVAAHWDRLLLRAWADGMLVQDGAVPPAQDVMAVVCGLEEGGAMVAPVAVAGNGAAQRFAIALEDPVLGRSIRHEHRVAEEAAG